MFYKTAAAHTRMFLLVDSSDHFTGKTGATPTVTLSKDGGAFAAAGGTVTEVANGFYKIVLTTTDTNTLGDLAFHCTAAGADATDFIDYVVAFDPLDAVRLGLTALPNAAAEAAGGLYTRGTGAGQINQDANGRVDVNSKAWAGTPTTLTVGVPDVNVKSGGSNPVVFNAGGGGKDVWSVDEKNKIKERIQKILDGVTQIKPDRLAEKTDVSALSKEQRADFDAVSQLLRDILDDMAQKKVPELVESVKAQLREAFGTNNLGKVLEDLIEKNDRLISIAVKTAPTKILEKMEAEEEAEKEAEKEKKAEIEMEAERGKKAEKERKVKKEMEEAGILTKP